MTLHSLPVACITRVSSLLPKGFIEVPTLDAKPTLLLISVDAISHVKVRDSKTCITLLNNGYFTGKKQVMTSHSYDQVKAMIAKAQK